ncbi:MAG TPA: hypothetical protein VFH51_11680, partial [Myxococcota bacterium]|nr:hypothetical protein [Myxococcota bacterium]
MKKRLARLLARIGRVVRRAVGRVWRPRTTAERRLTAQAVPLLEEPIPIPTWTYRSPHPVVT